MTRLISFLAHAVYMGTPLLFGTVGEIQNEKAGHLNLGVEGTMAMGACAGFMVAYKTGSLWLSILAAFLMGALVSLIYAFLTITMMANQNVTGLTLTIFGTGLSNFIGEQMISASPTGNLKLPDGVMSSLKTLTYRFSARYLFLERCFLTEHFHLPEHCYRCDNVYLSEKD